MKPKSEPKSKFQAGDMARLRVFTPPVLSGSIVNVKQARGSRYLVEPSEYHAHAVWVDEEDLDWVIG